jgi:phosphatidylglycerol:prolipoprotein diacylglycerol transferase
LSIGAIGGAALGSKLLYLPENPLKTANHLTNIAYLMVGKTIVGGLLGGLIGVETVKKRIDLKRSTGDRIDGRFFRRE